jgi:general secretion pathway protein D
MKTRTLLFALPILAVCLAPLGAQDKGAAKLLATGQSPEAQSEVQTFSSLDRPGPKADKETLAVGMLKFQDAELAQVLEIYQELSGRTVVRAYTLPQMKISVRNQTSLTRREALQLLDTVLAENGITMITLGTSIVKAVPTKMAQGEAVPVVDLPPEQLPESSSYMIYIVQLKHRDPAEVAMVAQQFSKMPNSIVALREGRLLVLRDYSANIRRMLQMIERIDRPE